MDIIVKNNQLEGRFEIACGKHVALLEYFLAGSLMTLVHTEVPGELEGNGFGGKLVKTALEHAKRNNLKINAKCEFAKNYIKRHEEYSLLLNE